MEMIICGFLSLLSMTTGILGLGFWTALARTGRKVDELSDRLAELEFRLGAVEERPAAPKKNRTMWS